MKLLNERYDYGLKLVLLSIDEGITGESLNFYAVVYDLIHGQHTTSCKYLKYILLTVFTLSNHFFLTDS